MKKKRDAQAAYAEHLGNLKTMLTRLQKEADHDFNSAGETIHWGHVGSLARLEELIKEAHDQTFHEGEYAN